MSKSVRFRQGEPIVGLRSKLNQVARQAASQGTVAVEPAIPDGLTVAVTEVTTVSGTATGTVSGSTATVNYNRMTYFTALFPAELFQPGSPGEVPIRFGPFPDISPT